MTFTVLLIALAHGIPIVLARTFSNTKLSATLVALAMCVFALAIGASQYAIFDLVAIGVVYFLCVVGDPARVNVKSPPRQSEQRPANQKSKESSGWGIVALIVIGFFIYNKATDKPNLRPVAVVPTPQQIGETSPSLQASAVPPLQQPKRQARQAHSQDTTAVSNATIQDLRDNCKPPECRIAR